jgi:Flp pilus assembly pilin Flp
MLKYVVKVQVRTAQLRNERGATATEYGLIVGGIALAATVPLWLITKMLVIKYTQVAHDPLMGW